MAESFAQSLSGSAHSILQTKSAWTLHNAQWLWEISAESKEPAGNPVWVEK